MFTYTVNPADQFDRVLYPRYSIYLRLLKFSIRCMYIHTAKHSLIVRKSNLPVWRRRLRRISPLTAVARQQPVSTLTVSWPAGLKEQQILRDRSVAVRIHSTRSTQIPEQLIHFRSNRPPGHVRPRCGKDAELMISGCLLLLFRCRNSEFRSLI